MNRKWRIDVNSYSGTYKYCLLHKDAWYSKWKHFESFETIEKAKEAYEIVRKMPVELN